MAFERCLNINVGVLGHVDSGKTHLVEQLSSILSTAALDKHPQSQERGITLDLGFSALTVRAPDWLKELGYDGLQFTFVDCPGHASLIRTVLGGAHIMDMMLLVVDITKGIQVQTAECIVIGEIAVERVLVALNKVDLIPQEKRQKIVDKATKHVAQTLKLTSFRNPKILPVSAKTRTRALSRRTNFRMWLFGGVGIDAVAAELTGMADGMPKRKTGPLRFAIDHCFRIKGQGTILTGTVLQGAVRVHDPIELPALKEVRKVKSIQMFKKTIAAVSAGDRAGICVTNLDPSRLERGLAAMPGSILTVQMAVASVEKVRFYAESVKSGQKLHALLGHASSIGKFTFFKASSKKADFSLDEEFQYVEEVHNTDGSPVLALICFEVPMIAPTDVPLVAARLDGASNVSSCRLALHGRIQQIIDPQQAQQLRIFKVKERHGFVKELLEDRQTAVCHGMFKKETDFNFFVGLPVVSEGGYRGTVKQQHGNEGGFLVHFRSAVQFDSENDKRITLYSKKYILP